MDDSHDLELLLRSRVPLIVVETPDETRVIRLFSSLALRLAMPVMAWSATRHNDFHSWRLTPVSIAG